MDDSNLYTVNVFKILNDNDMKRDEGKESQSHGNLFDRTRQLKEFQNMRSAKIIQGNILELEHSRLVGPTVKLKTVINYSKSLEDGSSLGLAMIPQQGYINKIEDNET